jgi:hypothetical protein
MPSLVTNQDETDSILTDITDSLHKCASTTHTLQEEADQLLQGTTELDNSIVLPYGSFSDVMLAIQNIGVAIASRTHDLEICIGEPRFAHFAGPLNFSPFSIVQNGYTVSANPVGQPIFSWRAGPRGRARPGCFLLETTWKSTVSGGNEREVTILAELSFKVDRDTPYITIIQTEAPRFLGSDGATIDPLDMVPIDDRSAIRRKLYDQIEALSTQHQIECPAIDAGDIHIKANPHFFSIASDLSFVCRTLTKRKAPLPLAPSLYGSYNQMVRLKQEHVSPLIRKQVSDKGGSVTSLSFNRGYAHLGVRKSESRSFLWISCDVTVDIEYDLVFRQTGAGVLGVHADWTRWRGHYQANLCYPVCDEVLDKAKEEASNQVEQYKTLDFDFADLSAQASSASGVIEPYGIQILLKGR